MADNLDEAKELKQGITNKEEEDADCAFANYIKIRLRKMKNKNLKKKARIKIYQILHKYSVEDENR